uniref:C-C motif chemokine n=1 Tax=Monopterus albus TaxID=43700 RepID=A0A3Q3JJA2_MONAL
MLSNAVFPLSVFYNAPVNENIVRILFCLQIICVCVSLASCCLRYARRPLPCKQLLGYSIQTINTFCDINAVIFHLPERFVCADPSMRWTQRGMKCVDEQRKKDAQIIKEKTPIITTTA